MLSKDNSFPERGFLTPPVAWKSRPLGSPVVVVPPMSERKRMSPSAKKDLFHVIHKVPAGDSPYVRAKHVQLIEKDPSRAISLFWGAINAGDRVDSALKDMAVVMKQLNRSDEAIEAIKSFRHLCPYDSQESLDNVLVELYKRSGRLDEEIEMLHHKLKALEEGMAFGGKKTKIARSQGKKIQITMEQERSRILGNLAWAYLQQHNYGIAEQHYRKALNLEPDKNKQCNLAICLMHMNKIAEAKSLIEDVRVSSGNNPMEDSYAKSFECAATMLTVMESQSELMSKKEDDKVMQGCQSTSAGQLKENWASSSVQKSTYSSPAPVGRNIEVLFSQPRQCPWGFDKKGDQGRQRWREDTVSSSSCRLSFEQMEPDSMLAPKLPVEPNHTSGVEKSRTACDNGSITLYGFNQPITKDSTKKSWADMVEEEEQEKGSISGSDPVDYFEDWNSEENFNDENLPSNTSYQSQADTVSQKLGSFNLKADCGTLGSAVLSRNPSVRRSLFSDQHQKPQSTDYFCSSSLLPRKDLSFDGYKSELFKERENDINLKRRNRLQVFQDITPSPESP